MLNFILSRKLLLLSAISMFAYNLTAQTVILDNIPPQPGYSPAHVFGQLDYTELTTGLHLDRAL